MRHIFNVIRFLLFIPAFLAALYGIYYLEGLFLKWLVTRNMFWIIVLSFFVVSLVIYAGGFLFGFTSHWLMRFTAYKKLAKWISVPIVTLIGLFNIVIMWKVADLEATRQILICIVGSIMTFYISMAFITGVYITKEDL